MPRFTKPSLPAVVLLGALGCVEGGGGADDEPLSGPQPEGLADDLTGLATYEIEDGELGERTAHDVASDLEDAQADTEAHDAIWAFSRRVLESHVQWVGAFVVFTDGDDGTLAQVFTLAEDPKLWALAIDYEDAIDADGEVGGDQFSATVVHEFAHILALNADQVTFDAELAASDDDPEVYAAKDAACDTYFLDEGCSRADAYIHLFHEAFWGDLADEEAAMADMTEDEEEAAADALFARFPDRFVSDYAATNATEDFAESFAHFVLLSEPTGERERDEKVRFFADFAELADIRADIQAAGIQAASLDEAGAALRVARHRRR